MMRRDNYKHPFLLATILAGVLLLCTSIIQAGRAKASPDEVTLSPAIFLPVIMQPPGCPVVSTNNYSAGVAYQYDLDNPVRPAWNHADKNLDLRGYTPNDSGTLQRQLVNYGSDDPNQPPQFATLFKPAHVPDLIGFYQIGEWLWAPSPDPGWRGSPITLPKVTALGLRAKPGESIYVPTSGYDIGGGMEVLILYADEHSVTLRYTREDSSGAAGYSVFIENICVDPNLLALYRQLDDPNGPRYKYVSGSYSYNLPNLPAGKPLGTALEDEVIVAISDTGRFWDPRSCNEWWQIRPGYTGSCPSPH